MASRCVVLTFALVVLGAWGIAPAMAYNCPVQIKQAEDVIKRAEASAKSPDAKALLDDAKKAVVEARMNHEQAKGKKAHADAVRKAKTAQALAEEAEFLSRP